MNERDGDSQRSSIYSFIPQMPATGRARPGRSQEAPGTPSGSLRRVAGSQVLGPSSASSPGFLAGSWTRSSIAGTRSSTVIEMQASAWLCNTLCHKACCGSGLFMAVELSQSQVTVTVQPCSSSEPFQSLKDFCCHQMLVTPRESCSSPCRPGWRCVSGEAEAAPAGCASLSAPQRCNIRLGWRELRPAPGFKLIPSLL